jgi:hypothetical protein
MRRGACAMDEGRQRVQLRLLGAQSRRQHTSATCSEVCRLVRVRTRGGASHQRAGAHRARRQACLCGPLSEQDEHRRAGHLHSSMRHTQEHRLVPVAAWRELAQACHLHLTMRWLQREICWVAVAVLVCVEERTIAALLALIDGTPVHLHPALVCPRGEASPVCAMARRRRAIRSVRVGHRPSESHHVKQGGSVLWMTGNNCVCCWLIDQRPRRLTEAAPCRGVL